MFLPSWVLLGCVEEDWQLGDNVVTEWAGGGSAIGAEADGELFTEGEIETFEMGLSESAISSLESAPEDDVEATLSWEGQDLQVSLRLRGAAASLDGKPSMKIDVHDFVEDQRVDGLKRVVLDNMDDDATMMRTHAYTWLAEQVGVPTPRHGYAWITLNGDDYGLYGLVEDLDEEFVEALWPSDADGNLYTAPAGADFTAATNTFSLEEEGDAATAPDDLEALIEVVEATPAAAGYDAMLDERFDRDALLAYLAIEIATGNADGYAFGPDGYAVYHAPTDERWTLVPSGAEDSFTLRPGISGTDADPLAGVLAIGCVADPDCMTDLEDSLSTLLDAWDADLGAYVEATAVIIADACEADPRKALACDAEMLGVFVEERSEELRAELSQSVGE